MDDLQSKDDTPAVAAPGRVDLSGIAEQIFRSIPLAVMITDVRGTMLAVNEAFTKTTGYSPEEALGANPRILKSGRHDAAFYDAMWRSLRESGGWQGEIWNRRRSGEIYPEWLSLSALRDPAGEIIHYIGIFSDISDAKRSDENTWHLAYHDALTQLPNRFLLEDRLSQALARTRRSGQPIAVLFVDLDGFKRINDTRGHAVGDHVLQAVAARLLAGVRAQDTVARIGGDEFVVVLEEISPKGTLERTDHLLKAIAEPLPIDGEIFTVSASIGIAISTAELMDGQQLIARADRAMYAAKAAGKQRYHFADAEPATTGSA